MRPVGLEHAFDYSALSRGPLNLFAPGCLEVDDRGRFLIVDYPDLGPSRGVRLAAGRNRASIVTFDPATAAQGELALAPREGFQPDLLRRTPGGGLLAVQYGQWPVGKVNGLLLGPGGEVRTEYRFGEGVADVAVDRDGRIFVLYNEEGVFGAQRGGQPLLELYAPDGDRIEGDPFLTKVLQGLADCTDGWRLHVLSSGAMLVNGTRLFDPEGALVGTLAPEGRPSVTLADEHDNLFYLPPDGGGLFCLTLTADGFTGTALESSKPLNYDDYAWHHVIRGGYVYLLNKRIPKVQVLRLRYE